MSYKVPRAPLYGPCPQCGSPNVEADGFVFGWLTARRQCEDCHCIYRGRTGGTRWAILEHCIDGGIYIIFDVLSMIVR